MLWLLGITCVWAFAALLAVALCVTASRADRYVDAGAPRRAAPPGDPSFVATLADPEPVAAPRPAPAAPRSRV